MKRYVGVVLLFAFVSLMAGCAAQRGQESVAIGNPWSEWSSLREAEDATGFSFDLPERVADLYSAEHYRTMAGEMKLLEVVYSCSDHEVTVRKAAGEGQDISGVYGHDYSEVREWHHGEQVMFCRETDSTDEGDSLKIIFDHDGYSWSIFAPNGFEDDSWDGFLTAVFGE